MPYDDLGSSREDKIWTYAICAAGGILILTLGPLLARWLADVPFVPFKEPLRWVGGFDQPWAWAARVALGLVAGLVVALLTLVDEWHLEVHDDAVVVVHDQDRRRLPREAIVGIHLEGKKIVIDGTDGRRLFEKPVEAGRERVKLAFASRGYPLETE
ncbi:hypothetical protein [Nocardioides sp. L-11A]|uniref:YqeB family protein n=1 Tax=Nocardioides sp. L-11A TaxID=3043848 RepID=UPI00249A542D|nr:hypothetical protein QJ852_13185 [Nocardioides sp. L-11A]